MTHDENLNIIIEIVKFHIKHDTLEEGLQKLETFLEAGDFSFHGSGQDSLIFLQNRLKVNRQHKIRGLIDLKEYTREKRLVAHDTLIFLNDLSKFISAKVLIKETYLSQVIFFIKKMKAHNLFSWILGIGLILSLHFSPSTSKTISVSDRKGKKNSYHINTKNGDATNTDPDQCVEDVSKSDIQAYSIAEDLPQKKYSTLKKENRSPSIEENLIKFRKTDDLIFELGNTRYLYPERAQYELGLIQDYLLKMPLDTIILIGHTDYRPKNPISQLFLSKLRSLEVKKDLERLDGLKNVNRIKIQYMGIQEPIVIGGKIKTRPQNRRVEVWVKRYSPH